MHIVAYCSALLRRAHPLLHGECSHWADGCIAWSQSHRTARSVTASQSLNVFWCLFTTLCYTYQTRHWVIGSPGQWVIFHVRVTGSSFWPGVRREFFQFSKKCRKCKTYIWSAVRPIISFRTYTVQIFFAKFLRYCEATRRTGPSAAIDTCIHSCITQM